MSKLITRIKRLALALCFVTPLVSWADAITAVNPVTGETETYTYKFIGTDTWNGTEYWQDSNGANPSAVPAKSGDNTWDPILFDGNTININASMSVEGWNLRLGLYNGANVRLNSFVKWQGDTDMWVTVDGTSKFTVGEFGKGNIADGKVIKCSTTRANGIEWLVNLESTGNANNTFEYYLAGEGSVSYQDITAANHKIKQADVALSGNEKSVQSKTLVSFTSTDQTFTADAAIKVKNGDNVLKTVYLTSVTAGEGTTLTTDSDVGACELVQTSTGIVLYYVDGDPADVVVDKKTYKPSISVNFTSGTALSTGADVGIGDYALPGTSWNNLIGNNGSLATVTGVDDAGVTSTINGAKVTISGTRGYYYNGNVQAASDLRQGYIDDNDNNPSPQFVVEGIPYYSYKTILYFSSDNNATKFGYVTVNGANYKGDLDNTATVTSEGGSDIWGSASVSAFTEGGNYLVIPTQINTDGKLTVVSHRQTGSRAGLAAVQIIEVKPEAGDGDLVIELSGDRTYTVSEAQNLSGTVYLTGNGTLTLDGSAKIEAATIDVGPNVTLNINADRLDATTFTGAGTVVYDGSQPDTTKGFDNSAWTGTVWVKNVGDTSKGEATDAKVTTRLGSDTTDATSNELNKWGNANSFVKFTNVRAFMAKADVPWTLVLEDDDTNYAWYNNEGWTARSITIAGLKGDGTFWDINDGGCRPYLNFGDASQFTGTIKALGKQVFLNDTTNTGDASSGLAGRITVPANQTLTVASGKTWHTRNGLVVNGTLNVNGTLASDSTTAAVSGSGTVVFTGRAPTPTGDTWWKNAAWTGTVQMKSVTDLVGASNYSGTNFLPVDYGNTGSVLELYNCSGWLPNNSNYQCTVPLKITGTLTINNGISGSKFVISSLSGDGTIYTDSNTATITIQVLEAANFTGKVQLNSKRVVFGNTLPSEFTVGNIYVGEGFSFTVPNSNVAWYGTGGITLAGELKAAALSNFGGGTTITTTDTGVFTLTSTGNGSEGETDTDYARIKGTGSLKYDGTGWRALSTNNFPTAVTLVNEQVGDILLSRALTYTVGSLSGSKNFQGNYGSGSRYLNVIQSKDTEWSGKVVDDSYSRFAGLKLDASSTGTLTLSGTASQNVALEVNGGAVNLTGTWKGATTVAGTIGGTGTLTGDLTFSAGSTFKAYATGDADGLVVSGTVTYPAEGKVTVDVSAIEPDTDVALLKAADLDAGNFTLTGAPEGASLEVVEGVLTLKVPVTTVTITIPSVDNTTVVAVVGEDTIATEPGDYQVAAGARVEITYTVDDGYTHTGDLDYVIESAEEGSSVTPDIETAVVVAKVINFMTSAETPYTTLQAAITALKTNPNAYVVACADAAAETDIDQLFIVPGSYTLTITSTKAGYGAYTQVEDLSTTVAGLWRYGAAEVAATFTWVGTELSLWSTAANWTSEDGVVTRAPNSALYTVQFPTAAEVKLSSDIAVAAMNIGAEVSITAATSTSITAGSVVLTDVDATLTVSGVTLNQTPTTTVESGVVVTEGTDPVTYSVALTVTFSLPEVEGATVASVEGATDNGDGTYTAIIGDTVTVTWVADEGKVVTGGVKAFVATAETAAANIPTPDSVVVTKYTVTVPIVEHTAITVTEGGVTVEGAEDGEGNMVYLVTPASKVVVKYTAVGEWVASKTKTISSISENTVISGSDVPVPAPAEVEYTNSKSEVSYKLASGLGSIEEGTYKLLTNITRTQRMAYSTWAYSVTIDLNGFTLTSTAPDYAILAGRNGTDAKPRVLNLVDTSAEKGGILLFTTTPSSSTAAISVSGKYNQVTIGEGVTVQGGAIGMFGENQTLTVNGTVNGGDDFAIISNGNDTTNLTLTVASGAVVTSAETAIYLPGTGTATIAGSVTGKTGVEVRSGSLTVVDGATITATGEFSEKKNGGGPTVDGAAVAVSQHTTMNAIDVIVSGGTLTGAKSLYETNIQNGEDTVDITMSVTGGTFNGAVASADVTGFITGGTFDSDPSAYVASGYKATETSTGVWTVTEKKGIDPTDPDSKQDVTVEPTGDDEADKAAAEAQGSVQIKFTDATVTAALQTAATAAGKTVQELYNSYFTYSATKSTTVENGWDVVATGIAATVTEPVETKAVADVQDVTKTTVEVSVPAGLYYKIETFAELGGTAADTESGISSGTAVSVDKPTSETPLTQSFVRVRISATEIVDPVADPVEP